MANCSQYRDSMPEIKNFSPPKAFTRDDYAEAVERAAIIEEGEGCSRHKAERITANLRGFPTWSDMMRAVQR